MISAKYRNLLGFDLAIQKARVAGLRRSLSGAGKSLDSIVHNSKNS